MPTFYAQCFDCADKVRTPDQSNDDKEVLLASLFETYIGINASPDDERKSLTCPRCDGCNTQKTFYGYNIRTYVRGDGFKDVAGARRDMHRHILKTADPYAEHRETGEADDLSVRLKKAGQHNPNPIVIYNK